MNAKLALVACGPQLEVGLMAPTVRGASTVRLCGSSRRSALILAAADLLLEDAGLHASSLECVVVSRGPGSFTGIRSGLATAHGWTLGTEISLLAYDSLLMQASRCDLSLESVWAAQPGRRGEVYLRQYCLRDNHPPRPVGEISVAAIEALGSYGPVVGAESLDLSEALRAPTCRSAAEALLWLSGLAEPQPLEPLYIEAPPVHSGGTRP